MNEAIAELRANYNKRPIIIQSSTDLFKLFISKHQLQDDFDGWKKQITNYTFDFIEKAQKYKNKISSLTLKFLKEDCCVLIHSYSTVVIFALKIAYNKNKRFRVYCTETTPTKSGVNAARVLQNLGLEVIVIPDTAVAYIMDKVSIVLMGAEGVVENGGIINTIGTYQLSILAKNHNKPFYVLAESYKFVRIYPLNQEDLPFNNIESDNGDGIYPLMDYTPPEFITLIVTDIGVLTPSGVSDELIKLHLD